MEKVNQILKNALFKKKIEQIEENEKTREFCKHGLEHLLAVARISALLNKNGLDNEILYAISLLHDIGKSESVLNHEVIGEKIAKEILDKTTFSEREKEIILDGILNHKVGGSEYSFLISEADTLSRNCFSCKMEKECKWEENRKNKELKIWK